MITGGLCCHSEDGDRLEKWATMKLMKLSKILLLGRYNQGASTPQGWLDRCSIERDIWVQVSMKLNTSQKCALVTKVQWYSGLGLWELIVLIYSSLVKHIWTSTAQEKPVASPAKCHKDDYETGAPDIQGNNENNGIFQPGEGSQEWGSS